MKKILFAFLFTLFAYGDNYMMLGDKEYSTGNFGKAIEYYTKAVTANPKNAQAYNRIGIAYYEMEDYQSAVYNYTKALDIQPNNLGTIINRGVSYSRMKDYKNASEDAKRACRLGDCELQSMLKESGIFVE